MDPIRAKWLVDGDKAVLQITNKIDRTLDPPQGEGDDPSVAIDVVFCQDVSGSMGSNVTSKDGSWFGTKLKLCQETQKFVVERLNENRLGLVTFDCYVNTVYPLSKVVNQKEAIHNIMSMFPGSSTNLSGGLHEAFKQLAKSDVATVKYLIVFTDGIANDGIIAHEGLVNLVKQHSGEIPGGLKLVILGYGQDCHTDLLQEMAHQVDGSFHYLSNAEDIPIAIGEEFGTALQTRQQNLELHFDPTVIEPVDYDGKNGSFKIGDLLKDESRQILFELHDLSTFPKTSSRLEYLDCQTSSSCQLNISAKVTEENKLLVSDNINIHDVTETTAKAAELPYREMINLIQECQKRLRESPSSNSEITKRLIEALDKQLERSNLAPPALLRAFSLNTKKQRGGIYAGQDVKNFRSLSASSVGRAVGVGLRENLTSETSKLLNPTNGLSRVGLKRTTTITTQTLPGDLFTVVNLNSPNSSSCDSPIQTDQDLYGIGV